MSCANQWLLAKNGGVLQIRMDQKDHMKMNFENFQIQK